MVHPNAAFLHPERSPEPQRQDEERQRQDHAESRDLHAAARCSQVGLKLKGYLVIVNNLTGYGYPVNL